MTAAVYLIIYASLLVFLAASVARARQYAKTPLHLRWELYPVPRGHVAQWRYMAVEIFLLRGLWHFNRALWFRSFPFHFGLYLIALSIALVGARVAGLTAAPVVMLSRVAGIGGIALALVGASALLLRRITDGKLRIYTTAGDIANLTFFIVAFLTLAVGYLTADSSFAGTVPFARALVRFDTGIAIPPLLAAGLTLASLLVAYIPLTHMSHFIAKYFTYHSIRWDDRENRGQFTKRIAENLAYRPTWAGRHVQADGARTWADVATSNPTGVER